jgi:hypothetical protein
LSGFPVPIAEVVEVEVTAAGRREEKLSLAVGSEPVDRCERNEHRALNDVSLWDQWSFFVSKCVPSPSGLR